MEPPHHGSHSLDPEVDGRLQDLFDQGVCAPADIDARVIGSLANLAPADAIECLDKLENAARKSEIRNLSAYLAGVVKRVSHAGAGAGPGQPAPPLAPPAQRILDQLYSSGKVRQGELDSKVLRTLSQEPADVQTLVMGSFADRNLLGIRNMAAFFASHISKVQQDVWEGRARPPPLSMPPAEAGPPAYRGPPGPDMQQLPPLGGPGLGPPLGQGVGPPGQQQAPPQQPGQYSAYQPQQPPLQALPQQPPVPYQPVQQQSLPPMQQQQPQQYAPQQPVNGFAQAPPLAALASILPPASTGMPARHFALEQTEWGVRVDEFHGLSPFAKYVHPAAALKLQQLWDSGNKLVSLLDDISWEALANLDAQNSLAAVNEVTEAMRTAPDDISTVNRLFMAAAGRQPKRPDGPTAALLGIAPVAAPAPAPVQPLPGLAQLSLPQLPGAGLAQAPLQQQPQVQGMLGQQQPFPGPAGPATLFSGQQQQYAPPPGAPGYQQQGPPPLQQQPPPPQQYIGGPDGPVEAGPQPPVQQPLPVQGAMFSGPLGTLPRGVQMHLTRIMNGSGGLVRPEHFDPKLVDMMERMGEGSALRSLDEFASNDYRNIRNVTGYLIGILKKYQAEAAQGGGRPGPERSHHHPPTRGGGAGYGGDRGGGSYDRGPPPRRDGPGRSSRWEGSSRGGSSGQAGGGGGARGSPRYDPY